MVRVKVSIRVMVKIRVISCRIKMWVGMKLGLQHYIRHLELGLAIKPQL